jgi:hypothetical protein
VEETPAVTIPDRARYGLIADVDRLEPFLLQLAGNSDVWLYACSNGPFTAGRIDPDSALFPYVTADKLLRHADTSGALTLLRVRGGGAVTLWEPWTALRQRGIRRNLRKSADSTEIVYEEVHEPLGLRFEWSLTTCGEFGVVRRARLENLTGEAIEIEYLDGWHQLVPPGIGVAMWDRYSYLAASYVRVETAPNVPLAVVALNAAITDHPEANESLRSTCAWTVGLVDPVVLVSGKAADEFRAGRSVEDLGRDPVFAGPVRGEIGAFLAAGRLSLALRGSQTWFSVADTRLDASAIADLRERLRQPERLRSDLESAVLADREGLRRRIAGADGIQQTADETASVHHYTNVLYNSMRGGTFPDSYRFPAADLRRYVRTHNRAVYARHASWLDGLPEHLDLPTLRVEAGARNDRQLDRLVDTYLPITFSRRHGDPSRPWNRFSIRLKDEAGEPILGYEGNWRDIFQNWEAVGRSFPGWLDSFISVFLDASTADGYNPYRVTKDGIDWEIPNPSDPWASIGYWGDHQLVYLGRLLESQEAFYPGSLRRRLADERYASVRVPYRIAGFEATLRDPHHTIEFDEKLSDELTARAAAEGADAKLVQVPDGEPLLVSLGEKLLLPLLVKLTNFVPEGGIWLNTQRPEWNDANNALAGWGLSMITVAYARRYLASLDRLAEGGPAFRVSGPVAELLARVTAIFRGAANGRSFDDESRFRMLRDLGRAGESHRLAVYAAAGRSDTAVPSVEIGPAAIRDLTAAVLPVLDATIRGARRADGLYDGYNVLEVGGSGERRTAHVRHLYPMLEGQVAAISSGVLSPAECLEIVRALRSSPLYRPDQKSYLLYPDLELPSLFERNTLPEAPPFEDRRLFVRDRNGGWHFQADLRNVADVVARLDDHGADLSTRARVLDLWEGTFRHSQFTGRSRTFFMFEGLGSIYWHMVAKLLLAVQEAFEASEAGGDAGTAEGLAAAYDEIRDGLGFRKSAEEYGAFPTDPYSHTPRHRKAQQPGMTGLVKEEILARWGELGVRAVAGEVHFTPRLLHREEFAEEPFDFEYVDLAGEERAWTLPERSLGFTWCGIPVCYRLAEAAAIEVTMADGRTIGLAGDSLPADLSAQLFGRSGSVVRVTVSIPEALPEGASGTGAPPPVRHADI